MIKNDPFKVLLYCESFSIGNFGLDLYWVFLLFNLISYYTCINIVCILYCDSYDCMFYGMVYFVCHSISAIVPSWMNIEHGYIFQFLHSNQCLSNPRYLIHSSLATSDRFCIPIYSNHFWSNQSIQIKANLILIILYKITFNHASPTF